VNDKDLLNGRRFAMVSSTSSSVDPDAPTEFSYEEAGGVIWGSYAGDTVEHGRFVGTRDADRIQLSYVHLLRTGERATGQSSSRIEAMPDGRLRLVEEFQFAGDGETHVSVCTELR
jgi:hypothetical protein